MIGQLFPEVRWAHPAGIELGDWKGTLHMSAPGESSGGKGGAGKGKGKAADAPESGATLKRKRGMFHRDLQPMMYGFGDDPKPMPETVELVEDILVDYITDMLHKVSLDTNVENCLKLTFRLVLYCFWGFERRTASVHVSCLRRDVKSWASDTTFNNLWSLSKLRSLELAKAAFLDLLG